VAHDKTRPAKRPFPTDSIRQECRRRCRRCPSGRERFRQCVLPARKSRRRRTGRVGGPRPARVRGPARRLHLLDRLLARCARGPARPRGGDGEAGTRRQIRRSRAPGSACEEHPGARSRRCRRAFGRYTDRARTLGRGRSTRGRRCHQFGRRQCEFQPQRGRLGHVGVDVRLVRRPWGHLCFFRYAASSS